MIIYKIKFFDQISRNCYKEVMCEKNIRLEAIEEYSQKVKEIDLPNGEYYTQLFRVLIVDGEEKGEELEKDVVSFPIIGKNHK